jgi:hypothetical protein
MRPDSQSLNMKLQLLPSVDQKMVSTECSDVPRVTSINSLTSSNLKPANIQFILLREVTTEASWMIQCSQVLSNRVILNQLFPKIKLIKRSVGKLLTSFQVLEETLSQFLTPKVTLLTNLWLLLLRAWLWKEATILEFHATISQLSIQTRQKHVREEISGYLKHKN